MGNRSSKSVMKPAASMTTVEPCHRVEDKTVEVVLRPKRCHPRAAERSTMIERQATAAGPRPFSAVSAPRSTIHADTRLVIDQLCAKRPKYCLLKQLDFDCLDERVQFLLFESVCDQLDQLGAIDRLRAQQARPMAAKTGDLDQIVADYRLLCSSFMAETVPELLLLTGYHAEELYTSAHKILAEMLQASVAMWQTKLHSLTSELLGCGVSRVRDSTRREIQRLLRATSQEVSASVTWRSLVSEKAVSRFLADGQPANEALSVSTRGFLSAAASWSWRAVCGCSGAGPAVLIGAESLKFDPRLHRTIIGPELPGAPVDCVLWPALCHQLDCVPETVLCKAMVKLR